jgi:hypothetical protein
MIKKQIEKEEVGEERLKKQYVNALKNIEGPILYESGSMIESWGDCTIISDEGVSYEPGGDTQVLLGPFEFNNEQLDDVKKAVANESEDEDVPDEWDYDEWEEAILMAKAKCKPNTKYYKLMLYGDGGDAEYYENMEDAENKFLSEIIIMSGRPNFERWDDMSLEELKYWCEELDLLV